jgi:hypothetical protein
MNATPDNRLSNSELDKILLVRIRALISGKPEPEHDHRMLTACLIKMVGGCTPQPTARVDNRPYFVATIARCLNFARRAW